MRYLNKLALGALTTIGLPASGAALAQQRPVGAPAAAPIGGDTVPPADLPRGAGPSGTSGTPSGPTRFDEVGYAAPGSGGAGAISVSGAGLPAAGFAEVTNLATGRTALVRTSAQPALRPGFLVSLSPDAARLLGISGTGPVQVRVRQVDPIAADQIALEQGRPASPRLDAPPVLLTGLRARMAQVPVPGSPVPKASPGPAGKAAPASVTPAGRPAPSAAKPGTSYPAPQGARPAAAVPDKSPAVPVSAKAGPVTPAAKSAAKPAAAVAGGRYRVRVGAFSNAANAKALAGKLGGHVSSSGKYWLVELGPFADTAAAKSARDGAAKRGYGDARVITN